MPCSCRRAYWWSSLRPRVFESSGLSPGFFPFWGPAPVSRLFLSLRPRRNRSPIPSLLGGALVRFCVGLTDALLLCPERAFRLFFASVSFVDPIRNVATLAEGICPLRAVALEGGVSPCVGFCRNPWGSRWLHLYRLTPVLVSLRDLAIRHLGLRSMFHTFPARRSACIPGDIFISLPDLYVYQHQQSRWVMLFGHLPC